MSIEENKAVMRRIVEEILNKGNMAVVDEVIATNYVLHGPFGEYKGPEGFKQGVTMFRNAFPDFNVTIEDMVAEGDMVALRLTMRGTFKGEMMGISPTDKQLNMTEAIFIRFAGGKEVEARSYADSLTMYQQLGIPIPGQ